MSKITNWSRCLLGGALTVAALTGCGNRSLLRPAHEQANTTFARSAEPEAATKQKPADALDSLKPGYAEQLTKARTAESVDRLEQAREIYQQLIREFPDRWEPYHRLGLVADRQRRHREARAMYEQALILKPLDAQILNDLGYCFYLQGQLEKAESALAKAVAREPMESRFRNNYGLVLGHQGRLDDALECFRRAGSEADAQYNMAFILATNEQAEAAKTCFRRALVADPSFTKAREALESFERYDRMPEDIRNEVHLADDGREWVPYVEGAAHAAGSSLSGSATGTRLARQTEPTGGTALQ